MLSIISLMIFQTGLAMITPPVEPVNYDLVLELDPEAGKLAATATLTSAPCRSGMQRFFLNRALTISKITVDGREVQPAFPAGDIPFFLENARAVDLPCGGRTTISYRGPGRLNEDGRNQVSADLVELSIYGSWYPLIDTETSISGSIRTSLPAGWEIASNGVVNRLPKGRILVQRQLPATDFTLIASPRLRMLDPSARVRVLASSGLSQTQQGRAAAVGADISRTFRLFSSWMGPPSTSGEPTVVFTPRPGPLNYSRLPVIIMPESSLADTTPATETPVAFTAKHEVAHFWSRASRTLGDDWINEGIAEYLALRATIQTDPAAGRALRERMTSRSDAAGSGFSFIDPGSQVRIARYTRPALMLAKLEERSSPRAMDAFLRSAATNKTELTTPAFINLVREHMGVKEAGWVSACVRRTDTAGDCW